MHVVRATVEARQGEAGPERPAAADAGDTGRERGGRLPQAKEGAIRLYSYRSEAPAQWLVILPGKFHTIFVFNGHYFYIIYHINRIFHVTLHPALP